MTARILLIGGSLNQTTMMHQVSRHLNEFKCYFTPFYADGLLDSLSKNGLLNSTILGGAHKKSTCEYLEKHHLSVDYGGRQHRYDAVITCTDLIVQKNIRDKRIILIQEGMTEGEDFLFTLVRYLKLPRWLANTAATGLSDAYDIFCVASPGYRDLFMRKGVKEDKIVVTGIPNFDHATSYLDNDFPMRHYVLAATSSVRETGKFDNRMRFLEKVGRISKGRTLVFKLHPNENIKRAEREIRSMFPNAVVFSNGNLNHMIANCSVLVTQYTSATYIGLALGKEVHSLMDIDVLRQQMPLQNHGRSAKSIAQICKQIVRIPLQQLRHPQKRNRFMRQWQFNDAH